MGKTLTRKAAALGAVRYRRAFDMSTQAVRPRDFSQAAKLVIASGQVEDREPTPEGRGVDPRPPWAGRGRTSESGKHDT
jgi:hypothetical protein